MNLKYDKTTNVDSRSILIFPNKGSLEGSNSGPSDFFFVVPSQGEILQPNPPLQHLVDSNIESDNILKNTQKPEFVELIVQGDSSPEIPPQGKDLEMEEDQHVSNIDEVDERSKEDEGAKPIVEDGLINEAASKPEGVDKSNQPFGTITQPTTTSTTTPRNISQVELDNLKETNPAGFLKAMMNARSISSEKGGTSSNISREKLMEPSSQSLLLQIKERVFDTNLIHAVNENVNACFGLKDFMKKVVVLSVSREVSQVLITLGFLIN